MLPVCTTNDCTESFLYVYSWTNEQVDIMILQVFHLTLYIVWYSYLGPSCKMSLQENHNSPNNLWAPHLIYFGDNRTLLFVSPNFLPLDMLRLKSVAVLMHDLSINCLLPNVSHMRYTSYTGTLFIPIRQDYPQGATINFCSKYKIKPTKTVIFKRQYHVKCNSSQNANFSILMWDFVLQRLSKYDG